MEEETPFASSENISPLMSHGSGPSPRLFPKRYTMSAVRGSQLGMDIVN